MSKLRVCVDARLISGSAGGVEQFIIGLACGLSRLNDDKEEYFFLAYPDADEWIRPYLSGPCHLLHGSKAPIESSLKRSLKISAPKINNLLRKLYPVSERWKISSLLSDGTIEKTNVDVMHFTHQVAFLTKVPSIYHPHDLQHKYFPQYYSKGKCLMREVVYRIFCRRAQLVAVASSWTKTDFINHYHLSEKKVQVIPLAPVVSMYKEPTAGDLLDAQQKFSLPNYFIFYPSQTWPHKNHLGLLDAIAILRDRYGMTVPLVLSGRLYEPFFSEIARRMQELHLNAQTRFLGFVSPIELQCLYRLAKGVVIPTKFEAGSFPLWEAYLSGVPAACSNVTSLPTQAGDAALIFDPDQPEEIADVIFRLCTNEPLRRTMIEKGRKNVANFSWERTSRHFRAHYRRIAGRSLTEEDRMLLTAKPLL